MSMIENFINQLANKTMFKELYRNIAIRIPYRLITVFILNFQLIILIRKQYILIFK